MKRNEIRTEQELIAAMANDEERATEFLYRMNYTPVLHFILTNSGNENDAREIYQQAFIILYEKLHETGFVLSASVGTFLFAVSKNLWLANLKEEQRIINNAPDDIALIGGSVDDDWESVAQRESSFKTMYKALDKLGEPCYQMLKSFYLEEKSMDTITHEMGYANTDSTKNLKYKCLQRLKKIVEKIDNRK